MRWVLVEDYSDEFNGTSLDTDKWQTFYPGWGGREPAKFVDYAISVGDGYLKITNGILDQQDGAYKYYGGAVTSTREGASYGYFESKVKASLTRMSTTFWLCNNNADVPGGSGTYTTEMDIQESIGNAGSDGDFMQHSLNSNTHYRHRPPGSSSMQFHTVSPDRLFLESDVGADFHTVAAWWRDTRHATFYGDNVEGDTAWFSTDIVSEPFDRPMFVVMVTETYSWTSPVIESDLTDPARNTSYYDWVRVWEQVPAKAQTRSFDYGGNLLEESLELREAADALAADGELTFTYVYKANRDLELHIQVLDSEQNLLSSDVVPALKGHGHVEHSSQLNFQPVAGADYLVVLELRALGAKNAIATQSFDVTGL